MTSLYQFNPGRKSWRIYGNTITSISGDDLTLVPYDNKDLILEASGNGSIKFKQEGITYTMADLSNVASGGGSGGTSLDNNNNLLSNTTNTGINLIDGQNNILLGLEAGKSITDGDYNIVLGRMSFQSNSNNNSVISIGNEAGKFVTAGNDCIFIGTNAGSNTGGGHSNEQIFIGKDAGKYGGNQGNFNIAIGGEAGYNGRNNTSRDEGNIAIGKGASRGAGYSSNSTCGSGTIAIGYQANFNCRPDIKNGIYLGSNAGSITLVNSEGEDCIAIGRCANQYLTKSDFSINNIPTNKFSVSVGAFSSQNGIDQRNSFGGLFLGYGAGQNIAMGNQIVLNGTGSVFDPTINEGLFVKPIRNNTGVTNALFYDTSSGEITYDSAGITPGIDASFNNVDISGSLTVSGNVTATAFYGDGSNLSGISSGGSIDLTSNSDASFNNVDISGSLKINDVNVATIDTTSLTVNGSIKADNLFLGANGQTPKIDMFFIDAGVSIWNTKIEIGKSDDFTNSPAYPPSNSYGMNIQANSDGLFVGVATYDGGSNWRPLLKWGDDVTDSPFRIQYSGGTNYFDFGTDGNYKMSGNNFYINDILHKRNSTSSYTIEPNLGWDGTTHRKSLLRLNEVEATLISYNNNNSAAGYLQLYPQNSRIYHSLQFQFVSDDRTKSYEIDVSNATDTVMKLKPKFYKKHPSFITDDPTPDLSDVVNFDEYGFIAQELNEDPALSHFVSKNPNDDLYTVNYIEMIPLLVQTIKELNERIKVLEGAI